jgi:hypothetical protein
MQWKQQITALVPAGIRCFEFDSSTFARANIYIDEVAEKYQSQDQLMEVWDKILRSYANTCGLALYRGSNGMLERQEEIPRSFLFSFDLTGNDGQPSLEANLTPKIWAAIQLMLGWKDTKTTQLTGCPDSKIRNLIRKFQSENSVKPTGYLNSDQLIGLFSKNLESKEPSFTIFGGRFLWGPIVSIMHRKNTAEASGFGIKISDDEVFEGPISDLEPIVNTGITYHIGDCHNNN